MNFHKTKKDILNGNIPEQILIITIPVAGTYLLQQLYQFVDYIVLGRYAGVEAMAAVGGSATMIINVLLNLIIGIATGLMIIVAQSYGRRDDDKVHEAVRTGMFIAIVFGGIIAIGSAIFGKKILILMGCPSDIIKPSATYLYLYLLGLVPYSIYTFGMYVLRATGDTKISLFFTIIIAVVKILLDILLTGVLKIGVWGVGIATSASYLVCGIVVLIILNKTDFCYHYDFKEFGFDFSIMKEIFEIGLPVAIQNTAFTITNAFISIKVNKFGTTNVAAFGAFNNVDNFYWCFNNAIGSAVLTIIGQNYGNKNMKRVKQTFIYGTIISLVMTVIVGTIEILFGRQIIQLFTTDIEVIEITNKGLKLMAMTYIFYILVEMVSSTIKGCGDATNSMIIAIIGVCVCRFVYLSTFRLNNLNDVIMAYPVSWSISSVIYLVYFLTNKKYRLR